MSLRICKCCHQRQAARRSPNCSACNMREWRAKNPLEAQFNWVKRGAEKRKIDFNLSLDEFRSFCETTGYLTSVGVNGMSIDRIDPEKGYEAGNIRILSFKENCRLGAIHQHAKKRRAA